MYYVAYVFHCFVSFSVPKVVSSFVFLTGTAFSYMFPSTVHDIYEALKPKLSLVSLQKLTFYECLNMYHDWSVQQRKTHIMWCVFHFRQAFKNYFYRWCLYFSLLESIGFGFYGYCFINSLICLQCIAYVFKAVTRISGITKDKEPLMTFGCLCSCTCKKNFTPRQ